MRKIAVYLTLFGVLASGAGLALADEMPPDMKMVSTSKPQPKADPSSSSHAQLQGVPLGGRERHNRMKHGHRMGMSAMRQSGMAVMAPSGVTPMQAGRGC